jgi:ribonuclease BN (tRNA processing enzyme)
MDASVHIQFLGTGDAFGSGGLDQTCFLVRTSTRHILMDCGCSGLISLKKHGIDPIDIDVIMVSHLHGDHYGGIPFFLLEQSFSKRTKPLVIVGPQNIKNSVIQLGSSLFSGSSLTSSPFPVNYVEYTENKRLQLFPDWSLEVFPVLHVAETRPHALRLNLDGTIIAYSGDTTWTDVLLKVADRADLFICECYTLRKGLKIHMSYQALQQNAHRFTCRQLYLTHCSEEVLQHADELKYPIARQGQIVPVYGPHYEGQELGIRD